MALNHLSHLRSADLDLKARKDEERSAFSFCVVQEIGLDCRVALCGPPAEPSLGSFRKGLKSQAIWQRRSHAFQVLAGTGGDNERRDERNFGGAMPSTKSEECVGAHEAKQDSLRRKFRPQAEQRLQSKVRLAGWARSVGEGKLESWFTADGQARHGYAIFKAGRRSSGLERLRPNRSEKDGIELKRCARCTGHCEMAEVRRIKTASEKCDPLAGCC